MAKLEPTELDIHWNSIDPVKDCVYGYTTKGPLTKHGSCYWIYLHGVDGGALARLWQWSTDQLLNFTTESVNKQVNMCDTQQ